MVAGLPAEAIEGFTTLPHDAALRRHYGTDFLVNPSEILEQYNRVLRKEGYDGTMKIVKEILDERSQERVAAAN